MSGHSKWAQIKRQKAAADAKRGQIFTKLGREITLAAQQGGGDAEANFRLRLAIQRAREANMPHENIERAIKRGLGGGEAATFEEIFYEGYGPGGAAILVEAMTNNRNRTAAEIRNVFARGGGNLGESGCVAWMFEPRGVITVETKGIDTDEVALLAIDAGAEDIKTEDNVVEIYTQPADLERVRRTLLEQKIAIIAAENALVPQTMLQLDEDDSAKVLRLLDKLEELDEVQRVYCNVDFAESALAKYAS
ncbi:MAG: YebC/PmpR family DNA-binding transcriptional regulator [Chloroflexi bacterium]|nr:YebC/PmpR family DNA-binding transcriptional regulator [Chloroflexota bacterium]MCL5076464.1 YebC/PmpR family DNA-binding transcriptional regulator [Chloroflexota bacterium]